MRGYSKSPTSFQFENHENTFEHIIFVLETNIVNTNHWHIYTFLWSDYYQHNHRRFDPSQAKTKVYSCSTYIRFTASSYRITINITVDVSTATKLKITKVSTYISNRVKTTKIFNEIMFIMNVGYILYLVWDNKIVVQLMNFHTICTVYTIVHFSIIHT